jgi:hypothetical protein
MLTLPSVAYTIESISGLWQLVKEAHLAEAPIMTAGLTGGGGTGSTVMSIQSGRTKLVLNPMALQSSSLIRFKIS